MGNPTPGDLIGMRGWRGSDNVVLSYTTGGSS